MKKIFLVLTIIFFIKGFSQQKSKFTADKNLSTVTYSMKHPLHEWSAVSKSVTSIIVADAAKKNVDKMAISIKVASFDSNNANRDSHMIEATEALKYPNVTFFSNSIKNENDKIAINGIINFHGKDKPIVFIGSKKIINGKLEISGSFDVKVTDFNLKCPSIMGLATEDDIKLDVKLVY